MDITDNTNFKVKTTAFEGPLELLVSLIEDRRLFVNDISLAQVTDDYIKYVRSLGEISADKQISDLSYFILIAATLVLIKSKSLLPDLSLTEDEEEKISDLEKRLKLYKIIKTASIEIKNNFGLQIIFRPLEHSWDEALFSPSETITTQSISNSINDVIVSLPKKEEKLPEIEIKKIINIDQVINSLTDRIENAINISFRSFAKSHGAKNKEEARVHVIVSFLAMLELVREGLIDVIQNNNFEDIEIVKQKLENNLSTE